MAVLKCKMCGGDLNITADETVVECEYCGSKQTVPTADNEKKMNLFARANRLLRNCEFDKAAGIYESIVAEFPEEAEAYWGLVLCKYGLEYVDDPTTGNKVPTCHRSSFDSVMDDKDFELVMEYADGIARRVYREQAKQMEELRKAIIEVSGKEEPYDIFISYKETDDSGERTLDSVIAQDIYTELTEKGYRVFFSRISLEDKLGTEYEPYIFAALNSAKVMLAVGTDYDYFNAVWVKNEWSRFLALIAKGEKKTLIPVFKNIDAYDMPKEFAKLSAQDMGKVGAMQDLLRGVDKILGKTAQPQFHKIIQQASNMASVDALLERSFIFLEDGDWNNANKYCEKVLDIDPRNAQAYLGKLMVELKVNKYEQLKDCALSFNNSPNYEKVMRFGTEKQINDLIEAIDFIDKRNEIERKNDIYFNAVSAMRSAKTVSECKLAIAEFESITGWKDADTLAEKCREKEEICRKNELAYAKKLRIASVKAEKLSALISSGAYHVVGLKSNGTVEAIGHNGYNQCEVDTWSNIVAIACGTFHTVGLKNDGTVVAVGRNKFNECNVNSWSDIIAISCGEDHTVGLKSDGTVVAVGNNEYGECNVDMWRDVVAISSGAFHTVGLRNDGTVVAVGKNDNGRCNVDMWQNVVAISSGGLHTVALKSDGTVVAAGKHDGDHCNVDTWHDIVAVYCSYVHTIGLKSDGTVVAVGDNSDGECNVGTWHDIVAVSSCKYEYNTIGLKNDGTVVAVGNNEYGECNVDAWHDIVAISCGYYHTVGLRNDGTVVIVGNNDDGVCDVDGWKLFGSITSIEEERLSAEKLYRAEQEATEKWRIKKIIEVELEKTNLEVEYANLKSLFSGKRRKEIETRLTQIQNELKQLGE